MSANFDILDATLDDIADLPEFLTLPAGAHKVTINWEQKTINSHPSLSLNMTYIEALELASPDAVAPNAGDKSSCLFMLDNEYGLGALKKATKGLAEALGVTKLSDIVAQSEGFEVIAVTKIRSKKDDKSVTYTDVVNMEVA